MTVADDLTALRRRTSTKWGVHPPEVLPMFIAESDFPTPPAIKAALQEALENNDTGYINPGDRSTAQAFADFSASRWGWRPDPERMAPTTDVSVVIVESLRRLVPRGGGVVITPPVYPPFYELVAEAGCAVVEVPLLDDATDYRLDLTGIDAALGTGAGAVLLCNPHNPVGTVHSREELAQLSRIVARHGAVVVSDEIHAPLTHHGTEFTPYLAVSEEAREHAIAAESGSKAFNLAGLKAALFVAASDRMTRFVRALPDEVVYRTGLFGLIATREGFANSREWLDDVITGIERNFDLLERELHENLPEVTLRRGHATYLAWLDMRALDWGNDPAVHALQHAKVALSNGPAFGQQGEGFARMNLACGPDTVVEAVRRLASAR